MSPARRGESSGGPPDWAAVLFDLVGTHADTVPLILHCYRHTMRTHRGRELPDADWLRTIGTPLRDQLEDFAADDAEVQGMLETYVSFQRIHHDGMVRPYAGARAVAETLAGRGAGLAVVTSKSREMAERTLGCCGLADLFTVLVAADDVTAGKPDPEPVLLALDRLGLNGAREGVLFVGDSPFDVTAGRRAGVQTAAALWGPFDRSALEEAGADHFVSDIADVLRLRPASV